MTYTPVFVLFPCRKKIQTTSAYIYETFFKQGTHSDVVIKALGKEDTDYIEFHCVVLGGLLYMVLTVHRHRMETTQDIFIAGTRRVKLPT